jgi:NADH-quinone oxidoreductase subunit L
MVTSGVYLLVRMNNVLTDDALIVIAVVGAATALFAALCAVAQHDIKKVLAYSTISQLGFMFLAIGSGAYVAAIFHVITHAFFKALLFLGSGSVIHGMGDEQDMRKMGALRLAMPITAATFIVGWLAIAGVPPFAGFWSKDEILLAAWEQKNIGPLLWIIGLITALLTAYYMSRQVILVFFGDQRWDEDAHPRESSWTMTTPLCVLAGAAIVGGAINLPLVKDWLVLEHFLEPIFNDPHHFSSGTTTKVVLAAISVCAGFVGISLAVLSWLTKRISTDRLEPEFLENAMYVDSTYARVVDGVGTSSFQGAADIDERFVDGTVNTIGKLTMRLGQLIRPAQSGYIRNYALGVALGALVIVALLTWGLLL